MPKTHWPDGADRSICGLTYPDVQLQFSLDASSVTCERCKKLLPEPTRTIWDRISDEDYQPSPRPRRRRPPPEKEEETVDYKEINFEDSPMGVLTPEEQDQQREEILENFPTNQRLARVREERRRQQRQERARLRQIQEQQAQIQQLQQDQMEEETRLEQGRRVTRQLITEFRNVYRRDQQTAIVVIFFAFIGLLFAVDLIQGLYHLVHTWLTAHK